MRWVSRRKALVALALALALGGCGEEPGSEGPAINPLYAPDRLATTAPDTFDVRLETSKGDVEMRVYRAWAPVGVDRFFTLVSNGFYDDVRIYRVLPQFMAQFGISGDGRVNSAWYQEYIEDDPVRESNVRGRVAFAKGGPNSRTTEIFISYSDANTYLDDQGFAPFGEVTRGMEIVDSWNGEYGDGPPRGDGPYAAQALSQGNSYLDSAFPALDRILSARVVAPGDGG